MKRLLDLPGVAERLNLSIHTIRAWASQRRIPTVRISRRVFVDERDLDEWIEAHREPARKDVSV